MYTVMLPSREEAENSAIYDNTNGLEGVVPSDINHTNADKYCMVTCMCGV